MANLSRRSLFGRVVRLPAIFPFKRQQDGRQVGTADKQAADEEDDENADDAEGSLARKLRNRLSARRRKRRNNNSGAAANETDRQLITINGKQYYVDDDGELRELKGGGKAHRRSS